MDKISRQKGLRGVLKSRLTHLHLLLPEHLTPLLREEIRQLITLHDEAIKRGDKLLEDREHVLHLDDSWDGLHSHWSLVFGSLEGRTRYTENLIFFQKFLTSKLLEDYDGQPYQPNEHALYRASLVSYTKAHPEARKALLGDDSIADRTYESSRRGSSDKSFITPTDGDDSDICANDEGDATTEAYSDDEKYRATGGIRTNAESPGRSSSRSSSHTIAADTSNALHGEDPNPLEDATFQRHGFDVLLPTWELMIDHNVVEEKLASIAADRRYPGGEIRRLIDQCDWHQLFATLETDRRLAFALFDQDPVLPQTFGVLGTAKGSVLLGIDKIQKKYFTRAGEGYVISKHALKLSGKQAASTSPGLGHQTHKPRSHQVAPTNWKRWESSSIIKHATSLYGILTGGRSAAAHASSATSRPQRYSASDVASLSERKGFLQDWAPWGDGSEKANE